ncbi:MAG: phage tail protein [Mycobacterium sp.]
MSLNDNAVLTAAVGWVYSAPVGTARPTPADITAFDPGTFAPAANSKSLTVTGSGGTYTISVGGVASAGIPYDANANAIKAAIEGIAAVGAGKVTVTGTGPFIIAPDASVTGTLTATGTGLTGGAATLTNVAATGTGWTNIGHTSRGDLPEFGFEGGDTEVKGTWQNESLREVVTDPVADYLTLMLHQFDTQAFELYYGKDASVEAGVFGVANGNPAPVEKALLIVIVDGNRKVAFYSPKASLRRDDSISLAVDEFATLPIRATFLKHSNANKFEWVAENLFA